MRVTLIRTPSIFPRFQATIVQCPPLGLAYVAAAARAAGHEVTIVDAVGEALDSSKWLDARFRILGLTKEEIVERIDPAAEAIAVSCMFSQDWPYVRELLALVRARFPHAPIIAGGEAINALPEFVLGESAVDHCVLGEGEETFVELLDALQAGRPATEVPGLVTRDPATGAPVHTPPRTRIGSPDQLPYPAWDLLPIESYLAQGKGFGVNRGRSMPIMATRGCPYRCTFCSSPSMWTTRWVAREPVAVLDEIRFAIDRYQAENFDFYDLTAIIKKQWIVQFCNLVIQSGLKFTWQLPTGTRSEAIDEEVAELLYESGCRNMTYAPESGSIDELTRIKKKVSLPNMRRSMRGCVVRGINVKTNIVLGFPGQTRRDVYETMRFLVSLALLGVRDTMVSLFSPYPGSETYRQLVAEGKLPPPGDEYFYSLISYHNFASGRSWSDHVTGTELAIYRIVGMLVFYGVSFARRPIRLFELVSHIVTRRHESPLERGLVGFAQRAMGRNRMARGESRAT